MPKIHATAVVEEGAQIAPDAVVGPFCYVDGKAVIGEGTRLISHVTILNRTALGRNNVVHSNAVLGDVPQDLKYKGEDSQLVIGDGNEIREMVTMHLGTANGGGFTRVGSNNLIMVGCHIAHDCILGDHIIMANAIQLAGHIVVQDHAVIGGAVAAHHFVTFGRYSFTGGMARIARDVPPFMLCEGNPAEIRGINTIGLERAGFSSEDVQHLKEAHRRLWRPGNRGTTLFEEKMAGLEKEFPDDHNIAVLVEFLRHSALGVFGRAMEVARADARHRHGATGGRHVLADPE